MPFQVDKQGKILPECKTNSIVANLKQIVLFSATLRKKAKKPSKYQDG